MYILAIDIGTESLRIGLIDLDGRVLNTASGSYPTSYPQPSWAEQNPEDWWTAARQAIPACLSKAGVQPNQIIAIGIDAFASTMVISDRSGKLLRPAILWMDARSSQETIDIEKTQDPVLRYGGGKVSVEWMLPRILWLKRNLPEIYDNAERIVDAVDWFTYRLTGQWSLSMNVITDLWQYVPCMGGWPTRLLKTFSLEDVIAKWPDEIYSIGDQVGEVTSQAAEALGLNEGTLVASGGVDAHVGLLGLNALHPGQMGMIIGSSTVQMTLTPEPVFHPGIWGPFQDSILTGSWLLECGQVSTGSILRWCAQNITSKEIYAIAEANGQTIYAVLDQLASSVDPGAGGLIALDYWHGNRTPIRDPLARGALVGLTLYHTPAHIYRSFLEAAAYGNYAIVETYREAGVEINEIVASGGGAKSDLWIQIHADVSNLPVTIASSADAMLVGCAAAGAVCAGKFADLREAAANMVKPLKRFVPDPARHIVYNEIYQDYKALYPALQKIFHRTDDRSNAG